MWLVECVKFNRSVCCNFFSVLFKMDKRIKYSCQNNEILFHLHEMGHRHIPKDSLRIKGQQKSQNCTKGKEKTKNFYQFNCHGHRSDTVEIGLQGYLFDGKAYCDFKFFLLSFIKLIIIKISFIFVQSTTTYNK